MRIIAMAENGLDMYFLVYQTDCARMRQGFDQCLTRTQAVCMCKLKQYYAIVST